MEVTSDNLAGFSELPTLRVRGPIHCTYVVFIYVVGMYSIEFSNLPGVGRAGRLRSVRKHDRFGEVGIGSTLFHIFCRRRRISFILSSRDQHIWSY